MQIPGGRAARAPNGAFPLPESPLKGHVASRGTAPAARIRRRLLTDRTFCYPRFVGNNDKPAANSRAELENRLARVFIEHGYEGASLSRLATASGLGKASLYHHFPGGKAEMASVLLTRAIARLDKTAFSRLTKQQPAPVRLGRFVDAFSSYVDHGERPCLIAVLDHGALRAVHGDTIRRRFLSWGERLAATFEETGMKPRRARRAASDLLAGLYGNLAMARMLDDASLFQRGTRRLKKDLPS